MPIFTPEEAAKVENQIRIITVHQVIDWKGHGLKKLTPRIVRGILKQAGIDPIDTGISAEVIMWWPKTYGEDPGGRQVSYQATEKSCRKKYDSNQDYGN